MRQPQVHVTLRGERDQHPVLGAVETGEPEHRQPLGQLEVDGAGRQVGPARRAAARRGTARPARRAAGGTARPARPGRSARRARPSRRPRRLASDPAARAAPSHTERTGRQLGARSATGGRHAVVPPSRHAGGSTAARPRRRPGQRRGSRGSATPPARAARDRSGSTAVTGASASATSRRTDGKSTPAQTPSRSDTCWASQRSTPRVGTATISVANGSGSGSASRSASPPTSRSERSARCRWRLMVR